MKRKMLALLVAAFAVLSIINSPGASAASATKYCDTPSGNVNDQVHQYEWTGFYDSQGYLRVRFTRATINNLTTAGIGTEYRIYLISDAGMHFDTGVLSTGARYIDYNVPSSANARTAWHPALVIQSGAENDGYARCTTSVQNW